MGATSGRPGTPTKLAFQSVSDLIADYVRLVILADGRWRLAQIPSFGVSADWYRTALITADAALLLLCGTVRCRRASCDGPGAPRSVLL
jgi:hypothetical protein